MAFHNCGSSPSSSMCECSMPLSPVGIMSNPSSASVEVATFVDIVDEDAAVQDISFMSFTHHNFNEVKANQITNFSRQSFLPWPNNVLSDQDAAAQCSKFENHFALKGTFDPPAILASFPGSGNTWLRYLIEGATGFFTRGPDQIFPDMIENGFLGNTELGECQGTTIMQKAHQRYRAGFYDSSKVVLVLRNPLEAIITFRHLNYAKKVKRADASYFQGFLWELHLYKGLVEWVQHTYSWLCREQKKKPYFRSIWGRPQNLTVTHYEILLRKPGQTIVDLVEFMGYSELLDPERLWCTLSHLEGKYHRTPAEKKLPFPFSLQNIQWYEKSVCYIDKLLKALGFLEGLPLDKYLAHLNEKFIIPSNQIIPRSLCKSQKNYNDSLSCSTNLAINW